MSSTSAEQNSAPKTGTQRRRAAGRALSITAGAYLVALLLCCLIQSLFHPVVTAQNLDNRLIAPFVGLHAGWSYILGGDEVGRPVLGVLLQGANVSLAVGFGSAALAMVIGVPLGLLAGTRRGAIDAAIMRVGDFWMSLPVLLVALVVLFVAGGGILNLILVLGGLRWVVFARVTRALTMSIRQSLYVSVAQSIGCSPRRVTIHHVLRNMRWDLLSLGTLETARAMLAEASLSFLGLGVQPPNVSWGTMLSASQPYLASAPWFTFLPGFAILLTTLSLSLVMSFVRSTRATEALSWRELTGARVRRRPTTAAQAAIEV
jgi:peptide/nickel transport system permease protein